MNKPTLLYHASPKINVDKLEPRNEFPRFTGENNLVFATEHLTLAAMFLTPRDIPIEISVYGEKYVIFINADEAEYALKDEGGAIYTLPSATFEVDPSIGMGTNEWSSKLPVRPISKTIFKSSIEAMDFYGVTRYFVDDVTMKKIRANPANALDLMY